MPDENTAGQPTPVEPSPAPVETAPATEPIPQAPAPVPDKLAGRSAEEIAAQYLELEKKLGEQGRELGELRQRIPQYQPQPPVYYPPQFTQPEVRPEFDYGKPEESIDRRVEWRFEQERQQRAAYEVQRQGQEAQFAFNAGKAIALKQNPDLYTGIEPELEQAAQMAHRLGAPPSAFLDPKYLETLAVNIRHQRGELSKIFGKAAIQPPTPSATAVPNQTRQAKVGVELSDDERRWAKDNGLSEQEAREIIENELAHGGGK